MKVFHLIPFFDPSVKKWSSEARFLQWLTGLWLAFGLIILYSASFKVAIAESGDGFYYLKRQIIGTIIGLFFLRGVVKTPIRKLLGFRPLAFLSA